MVSLLFKYGLFPFGYFKRSTPRNQVFPTVSSPWGGWGEGVTSWEQSLCSLLWLNWICQISVTASPPVMHELFHLLSKFSWKTVHSLHPSPEEKGRKAAIRNYSSKTTQEKWVSPIPFTPHTHKGLKQHFHFIPSETGKNGMYFLLCTLILLCTNC